MRTVTNTECFPSWAGLIGQQGEDCQHYFYRSADSSLAENVLRNPDNFLQSPI